jgi:hypothetical protein
VNPTYAYIKPLETIEIKFLYYIKDLNENPHKHKFKFEAVLVPENLRNKDPKALFEYVISNRLRMRGFTVKRGVVFNNQRLTLTNKEVNKSIVVKPVSRESVGE